MTRFYFHLTTDSTSGLPTTEQSALTATFTVEAATLNRGMDTNISTGSVQQTRNSLGPRTTSLEDHYHTRFVSPPIYQSSVAANTWTYNFATRTTSTSANFPVSGTNQPVYVNCYVWRPSTSTKVGTILDGNTASLAGEGAINTMIAQIVTFTGSAVSSVQNGDVIILEIWFRITQAGTTAYNEDFLFDGTVVNTVNGGTVTSPASFLETPETLSLTPSSGPITMTIASTKTLVNKFIEAVGGEESQLDHWGTTMLFPTTSGGIEYHAPLDVGGDRSFSSSNNDPGFADGITNTVRMRAIGSGTTYTIDTTNQTIEVDGSVPRLYFIREPRSLKFENIEVTHYYKMATPYNGPSYGGAEIGARGSHDINDPLVRTYYVRHGFGNLIWYRMKEENHPSACDNQGQVSSVAFNADTWYGVKLVIQTMANGSVRHRTYRDTTDGAGGGTWILMTDFTDDGNNWPGANGGANVTMYKDGITACDDCLFFLRQDDVTNYQMKKISCHEIDPLP